MKQLALQLSLALFAGSHFSHIPDRPNASDRVAFAIEDRIQLRVNPFDRAVVTPHAICLRGCWKAFVRRLHRRLVACAVVRMDESEKFLSRRRRCVAIPPEYSVVLVRTDHFLGTEIALKASDLGEPLGAIEIVPALPKLVFCRLHLGDVD